MGNRSKQYEFEGAQSVRDEAKEYMMTLFPKAKIQIGLAKLDGQIGVMAIIGNTAPHSSEEIVDCLGQLGVSHVRMAEAS